MSDSLEDYTLEMFDVELQPIPTELELWERWVKAVGVHKFKPVVSDVGNE